MGVFADVIKVMKTNIFKTTLEKGDYSVKKLTDKRNLYVDLSSKSKARFDGTQDVNIGVTGTLPIENGGTNATDKLTACKNLGAAMVGVGEIIQSYADLNTYIKPGTYRSTSGTVSETLLNTPYKTTGFKLEVFNTTTANQWIQEIKANSASARTYRRVISYSQDEGETEATYKFGAWYKVLQVENDGGALSIANGGTGANTVEGAREKLNVPSVDDISSGVVVPKKSIELYPNMIYPNNNAISSSSLSSDGLFCVLFYDPDGNLLISNIYIERNSKSSYGTRCGAYDGGYIRQAFAHYNIAYKALTVTDESSNRYNIYCCFKISS